MTWRESSAIAITNAGYDAQLISATEFVVCLITAVVTTAYLEKDHEVNDKTFRMFGILFVLFLLFSFGTNWDESVPASMASAGYDAQFISPLEFVVCFVLSIAIACLVLYEKYRGTSKGIPNPFSTTFTIFFFLCLYFALMI